MKYQIALMQKGGTDGLTKSDIQYLLSIMPDDIQVFPIELEAHECECSAQGFIGVDAANILDYDYEGSGLHNFVAHILDDVRKESPDNVYDFNGQIWVWLGYSKEG